MCDSPCVMYVRAWQTESVEITSVALTSLSFIWCSVNTLFNPSRSDVPQAGRLQWLHERSCVMRCCTRLEHDWPDSTMVPASAQLVSTPPSELLCIPWTDSRTDCVMSSSGMVSAQAGSRTRPHLTVLYHCIGTVAVADDVTARWLLEMSSRAVSRIANTGGNSI